MGGRNWSSDSYSHIQKDYSNKTQQQVFTNTATTKDMNPHGVKIRESRDSDVHPLSVAIETFVDITGSMGDIPEYLIKHKLGTLMETLIKHGVADAHVLFGAVGDQYGDRSPLQVGQFEAGTEELNKWLSSIHIEKNGQGQGMESYPLTWYFSSRHTSIDCFEKRQEKGFLFTIGDEGFHPLVEKEVIKEIFGDDVEADLESLSLLKEAQRTYNVFHLHVETGNCTSTKMQAWKQALGERFIVVPDKDKIAEIMATTVAVIRGANLQHVVGDFDSHTAGVVSSALVKVSSSVTKTNKGALHL